MRPKLLNQVLPERDMSDKLARTIQRFQAKIDSGSFYEAHQTLRTITNRYVKAKQYKEARDLLYQGSTILLKNKEFASASDLINYLIQIYDEEGILVSDKDAKLKLIDLISNLPNNDPSLSDLAKSSLNWSKKSPGCEKFGDCELHHLFGSKFLKFVEYGASQHDTELENGKVVLDPEERAKVFAIAELHLVLGTFESVPLYINYLVQYAKANPEVDPGVFLGRAIVNYSYLKNIKFVKEAQDIFLKEIEVTNKETLKSDFQFFQNYSVLNFLQLLVITLQKEHTSNSQKFVKLYEQYRGTLQQYELLAPVEYLGKIYFNVNIGNSNQQGNMLANIMSGLFK